jgi:phosphotransferase system HPr (HPr) family protein
MPASSERTVELPAGVDLHARPAAAIARAALGFESEVSLALGERSSDAKSALTLMTLGATAGSTLTLRADGPDSSQAVEQLGALIAALDS